MKSLNEYSNYWETIREHYYPFESGLKAGTAEVYKHEIPGGQYSNLKPQAVSLGLGDKMDEIKKAYEDVNELFGDIVKVTPSSKVVGDLAQYMVSNGYSKEDILEKGESISFPQSVKSFFKGDLGQPYGGFPEKLQKLILKDEKPYTELPNAHMEPIVFETELAAFYKKFDSSLTLLDFLSYKFYPKVFEEYYAHHQQYGNVSFIPSLEFFYGMKNGQEIMIEIAHGKNMIVKLEYVGEPDENGVRIAFFKLNGQGRAIEIKDKNISTKKLLNRKVSGANQIGAPLQGMISKIFVKAGDTVPKNAPLFTIEAMKMETTITANQPYKIKAVELAEGKMVDADDLVIETEGV